MLSQKILKNAVQIVNQGGVIAYPTESTYGLGCDPANLDALKRILQIKQRPAEKGLIILVSDIAQAKLPSTLRHFSTASDDSSSRKSYHLVDSTK